MKKIYSEIYNQSIKNPEEFWENVSNDIFWYKKPKKILNKSRGFLHIEIPSLENPLISLYKIPEFRNFWFQEPHKYYFTSQSVKDLLLEAGFKIENMSLDQLTGLPNHFNWLYKKSPMKDKSESVNPFNSIPITDDFSIDNQDKSDIIEFCKKGYGLSESGWKTIRNGPKTIRK